MDKSKNNKQFCFFICLALFYLFIVNAVNGIDFFEPIREQVSTGFKAVIGLFFLMILPKLVKCFELKDFCLLFASGLIIMTNYVFFPDLNIYFMSTATNFLTICLPIALVSSKIDDYDCFFKYLLFLSRSIAVLAILFVFDSFMSVKSISYQNSYSMGLGYGIIIPILILLYNINNKTKIDFFFLSILLFVLVLYCSRGPVFSIGLFFVYLFVNRNIKQKKTLNIILLLFALLIVTFSYKALLYSFGSVLEKTGLQSRSIQMLSELSNEKVFLNQRDELWNLITDDIMDFPFKVRGINAEWEIIGGYAHSIIYELTYQGGLFFGSLCLLVIFSLVAVQLFSKKRDKVDDLLVVFMIATIPPLMVSNSLWISSSFWLWIGLTMGAYSKKRIINPVKSNTESPDPLITPSRTTPANGIKLLPAVSASAQQGHAILPDRT